MDKAFMVHTGSVIKEYLEEAGISAKEATEKLKVEPRYFSNLLKGEADLTVEVANNLENLLVDIPASYWLNYETKFKEYKELENREYIGYDNSKLIQYSKRFKFNNVFNGLGWSLKKQAKEMLEILQIESFEQFDTAYAHLNVDFMEDGGEKEAIAIWLNLAREEVDLQNKDISNIEYEKERLLEVLPKFKALALNSDYRQALASARKLLNRLGVYLVVVEAIVNSKVRGAITTYANKPAIYLSERFKTHDHVWFALMHEIGHLIKHHKIDKPIVTLEDELEHLNSNVDIKEKEANEFARNFFIDKKAYNDFISLNQFREERVIQFAKEQNVLPGIVVARLQHDDYISFDKLNYLKNR